MIVPISEHAMNVAQWHFENTQGDREWVIRWLKTLVPDYITDERRLEIMEIFKQPYQLRLL